MKKEDVEAALLDAMKYIQMEGGNPTDMWYPGYGCVLRDGKETDSTRKFYEKIIKPMLTKK